MSSPSTIAVVHFPSGGHIRPLLPLVGALARSGLHTVQLAPAEWEDECLSAGGEFRALPDLSDLAWPSPSLVGIAEFLVGLGERLAPWMTEQLDELGADAVLRDSFAQYGRWAARANGLREVVVPAMMAFHPRMRPSVTDLPLLVRASLADTKRALRLRRLSRRLSELHGTPLGGPLEIFAGRHGSTTLVFTTPSLQMRPAALAGEDIHFVGPLRGLSEPETHPDPALAGIAEGERVIYVSLGTVFEQNPSFFRDAARALAAPGRRVIMSTGRLPVEAIGELPPGVSAHAYVDQLSVLRRSDLFLTHAGFNSVQEGLAAGVPLLLCPQMFEQALNADVVVGQGAGLRLKRPSEDRLRGAADRMLAGTSYSVEAQRLSSELRAGTRIEEAVEVLAAAASQPLA